MCMEIKKVCKCGRKEASFHLRDNVMIPEVISQLYCPSCSGEIELDSMAMIHDNGWVIEYDMILASSLAENKLGMSRGDVNPEFLFDQGYATWKETYPGELEDIVEEKEKVVALMKEDPKRYFQEIRRWANARMERLKEEGWRKAQAV